MFLWIHIPGIQQPLEGGVADVKFNSRLAAGDIPGVEALQNISKTAGKPPPVSDTGSPDLLALPPGTFHPRFDPFPDHL